MRKSSHKADEPDGKNYAVLRRCRASLKGIWPAGYPPTMWNMTIILCTFVGLMGVLVFAFINFDVLVQIEYRKYKDEWSIDGKPRGFFWRPPESTWFASSIATQKLSFRWLFQTPHWVKNDTEAICRLKRLRLSVLIFNAGIFLWLIISILLSENYIKPAGWR